jgi:hypothetical protein
MRLLDSFLKNKVCMYSMYVTYMKKFFSYRLHILTIHTYFIHIPFPSVMFICCWLLPFIGRTFILYSVYQVKFQNILCIMKILLKLKIFFTSF